MRKTRNVDELLVTSNFSGSPGQRRENLELFDFRREDRSPVFGLEEPIVACGEPNSVTRFVKHPLMVVNGTKDPVQFFRRPWCHRLGSDPFGQLND